MNNENEKQRYTLYLTLDELKSVAMNLDQCRAEGYISHGDPAYDVWILLVEILKEHFD